MRKIDSDGVERIDVRFPVDVLEDMNAVGVLLNEGKDAEAFAEMQKRRGKLARGYGAVNYWAAQPSNATDSAAGVDIKAPYTPNDMHAVTITLNPGQVVAIPITGPVAATGALPEGSGGQMCVSRVPGEFNTDETKVSVGRGLLVRVSEGGQWYANVKLLLNMTAPAPLTFNAGQL